MKIGFPLDSALQGISKGLRDVNESAAEIASAQQGHEAGPEGIARSLVNLYVAQSNVEASAQVVRATDEMLGTIIDTLV
ncbi:MAG: hypothetical protein FD165_314 [Gammaproteobacteria bacterium]|nr:MAG: hypothetical protein FD165_314 [Gammaproteobacteria bacterium]TND06893.1 MAG: hypothetical protein FD120_625 [Gammaproteobacteria bacterium]